MRYFTRSVCALAMGLLLFLSGVHAQTPAPVAPSLSVPVSVSGEAGSFITIPATTSQGTVKWFCPDKGLQLFPSQLLKDSRTAVVVSNVPGTYRLYACAAAGDVPLDLALCLVTVTGSSPTPQPVPTPSPVPGPSSNGLWLVVIKDDSAMTLATAKVIDDSSLWSELGKQGYLHRVFDVNAAMDANTQGSCPDGKCPLRQSTPLVNHLGYAPYLQQLGGAPILLVLTGNGKVLQAVKLPGTSDGVRALLK
jgi:hypothetical protein